MYSLFSGTKASLEATIEDCCVKFGEAGFEVGLDKTHWSSLIAMDGETLAVRGQSIVWERKLEYHWVSDRAWCAQWWSGETPYAKGVLGLLQVETSLVQSEPVFERENESVWGEHSFECYIAEWLLDSVEATRTRVAILVRTSLEPDGGFSSVTPTTTSQLSGGSFTLRDTNRPGFSLSAQLICTFVTKHRLAGILPVLKATILCIRCWLCSPLVSALMEVRTTGRLKIREDAVQPVSALKVVRASGRLNIRH